MDTNLRKLKRVQLLQLMVELSEDRDALIAENMELEKQLAYLRQRGVGSSTMKVGSIAEAALQANGFFESAQNAADDYLREIKQMRDKVAQRSQAGAAAPNHQVQQGATGSQADAAQVIATAAPVQVAPGDAAQLNAEWQRLEQYKEQLKQQRALYQQQIDQMKTNAEQEARAISDRVLARANAEAKAVAEEAQARAEAVVAEANRKSHVIVSQANRQAKAILTDAKQQAAQAEQSAQVSEQPEAQAKPQGATPQKQITARLQEMRVDPSSTAEIRLRARHGRATNIDGVQM